MYVVCVTDARSAMSFGQIWLSSNQDSLQRQLGLYRGWQNDAVRCFHRCCFQSHTRYAAVPGRPGWAGKKLHCYEIAFGSSPGNQLCDVTTLCLMSRGNVATRSLSFALRHHSRRHITSVIFFNPFLWSASYNFFPNSGYPSLFVYFCICVDTVLLLLAPVYAICILFSYLATISIHALTIFLRIVAILCHLIEQTGAFLLHK